MRRWYLILCALVSLAGGVSAQDSTCASPATTLAERRCLSSKAEQADKAMGVLVDSLRRSLSDSAGAALDTATRQWSAYRKAECDALLKSYDGGSMGLIENLNCIIALTVERQRQLRLLYSTN
jgi:uncharacterized protein YecT (DUF1311 family)